MAKKNLKSQERVKVNTEVCITLKTLLQHDARMKSGKEYNGILRHDRPSEELWYDDDHYTFVETLPSTDGKRNPRVFSGDYITITRRDDGSLRPNFKPMTRDGISNINAYAIGVMNELRDALTGLVKEGGF